MIQVFDESLELFEHGELNQAMQSFTRLTNHRPAQAFITRIKADLAAIDSGELDQMAWSPIWEMTTK